MKRKKVIKQKLLVIFSFVLGIGISIYIKSLNPEQVYVPLSEIDKVKKEINYYKEKNEKLEMLLIEYKSNLDIYKNNKDKIIPIMKDELYNLKIVSGYVSVRGNGIEVKIHDSEKNEKLEMLLIEYKSNLDIYKNNKDKIIPIMKDELYNLKIVSGYVSVRGNGIEVKIHDSEKKLKKGQNPNELLIHDIDILKVINDLKKSGAEAISINGERIVSSSEIKCSGPTITINGKTYGQPFVIKAIGDSDMLKASLISPGTYANLLKKTYGIYIDVIEKNDIFINSYQKHT